MYGSRHHNSFGTSDNKHVESDRKLKQVSRPLQSARKLLNQFDMDGIGAGHLEKFFAFNEQRYDDESFERVHEISNEPSRPPRIDRAKIEAAVCRHFESPINLSRSCCKDRRGSFGRGLNAIALNEVAKRNDRDQVTLSRGLKA